MNKSFFKLFSLTTVLALMLIAAPMQLGRAAGAPADPSLLEVRASFPGDLSIILTWSDNSLDETAFEIERCISSGCTNFANIGATPFNNINSYGCISEKHIDLPGQWQSGIVGGFNRLRSAR